MDSIALPRAPAFEVTTRLFARALGCSSEELLQAFRPARVEDMPAVLAFRQRRGWDDAAYVRWRYGLDAQSHPHGRLWILRMDAGPVLAGIGTEVQPIRYGASCIADNC
ncbi:hypothetical protein [Marilutibacter alkalisoli]|uniref:Uncharacterized protein n=1 Tax=Marilutibacter alkalisoli TaxID=2591633 RepID=A0A514BRJ7_9GAMM|nr:hypothetical protein [Lysobacter alkalisoli]QDH70013.1 hypothetical protein FKV23_07820 [Lysobacter alkalisoli]